MVFGAFERMVSFRYLRARREEGFVSVIAAFSLLGIMLGVGTLIVVMSVMNGFRAEFLKQILGFQGDISVLSSNAPKPLHDFDALTAAIRRVPGIVDATPIVDSQILIQSDTRRWMGVAVRGTRIEDLKRNHDIADHIVDGSLDAIDDNSIMLGFQVALSMGVHAGDTVTLISPQGTPTPIGVLPRRKAYRVAATFDTGFAQFDSGYAFLSLAAAQTFFAMPEGVTSIQIFVEDPESLKRYSGPLAQVVGERGLIQNWQDRPSAFLNALGTERAVMFFILTLIILVAVFNVISSMIMLVRSKGRDIAILRTMGATRGMVLRVFFLTGASIGTVGTLLGLAIGLAFAANIEAIRNFLAGFRNAEVFAGEIDFLSRLQSKIDPAEVIGVAVLAFALSFLATLYPAWQAARLDPVEALRYE
jgi:lipoprotein-releasing system permease protein